MQKIDKNCSLSTCYKRWEEALENKEETHPKYNSSNFKYYKDIVMQLYACQGGLCAYTEQELCDDELFATDNWEDGKYIGAFDPVGRFGQLEHFDERLKAKGKDIAGVKDWLWDNFFMVHSDINNRKGTKPVDNILKPDNPNYDPFRLLEYDYEFHMFIPNSSLNESTSKRVKNMIDILGINQVYFTRKKYLKKDFRLARLEPLPIREIHPEQYPTSFEMCVQLIEKEEITLADLT